MNKFKSKIKPKRKKSKIILITIYLIILFCEIGLTDTSQIPKISFGANIEALARFPFSEVKNISNQDLMEFDHISLNTSISYGIFESFAEVSFRDTPLGGYPNIMWIQEAYIGIKFLEGGLRIGKIYNPISFEWDLNSYGSLGYYLGFTNDSDYGASFYQKIKLGDFTIGFNVSAFLLSDGLNGSRDGEVTQSIEGYVLNGMGSLDERGTFTGRVRLGYLTEKEDSIFNFFMDIFGSYGNVFYDSMGTRTAQYQAGANLTVNIWKIKLLAEIIFYDLDMKQIGGIKPRGYTYLGAFNFDIVELNSSFLKSISFNYAYGSDIPRDSNIQYLHTFGLLFNLIEGLGIRLEYIRWLEDINFLDHAIEIRATYEF